jgi:magnesium-transporting ATPase (P-type)
MMLTEFFRGITLCH